MSDTKTTMRLNRSIIASAINEDEIVTIDSTPTIFIHTQSCGYVNHTNLKGFGSLPYRYGHSVALSPNGQYALVCDTKSDKALFIGVSNKKIIANIKMNKGPNYTVFSHDSSAFMIANGVGRVGIYLCDGAKLLYEFAVVDEISCASFSEDRQKLVIGCLDKKIYVIDIYKKNVQKTIELEEVPEAISFSYCKNHLIAFTRNGNTSLINITMNQHFKADPLSEWPSVLSPISQSDVILVGSRSSQLFVYTASKGIQLGSINLDYWGITSIVSTQKTLFVGFSDGNGEHIDISQSIQEAFTYLEQKNYEKLSLLASSTPLIFINLELCQAIDTHFKAIFAYHPIAPGEKKGYDALVALILSNNEKRAELLSTLYASAEIVPFMEQLSNGEVEHACNAANDSPLLRQLREFNELRTRCFSTITQEIHLLEESPEKLKAHIESMPHNCITCVSGIIPSMQSLETELEKLKSSAAANNYAALLDITERFPIFRQTRLYRKMMNYGEALIDRTLMMMRVQKMSQALEYATKLSQLKPFARTGLDFKEQINNFNKFKDACEKENLAQIFAIATDAPAFKATDLFKAELERYKKTTQGALFLAQKGDLPGVKIVLAKYAAIEYFEEKNLEFIKLALLNEIRFFAPYGEEEKALKRYHECFGWDEEYDKLSHQLQVTAIQTVKLEEISSECKSITTFIEGQKIQRTVTNQGAVHEH